LVSAEELAELLAGSAAFDHNVYFLREFTRYMLVAQLRGFEKMFKFEVSFRERVPDKDPAGGVCEYFSGAMPNGGIRVSSKRLAITEGSYVGGNHIITASTLSRLWVDSKGFVEAAVCKAFIKQPKIGFY
jgi:hypothetical protein